MQPKDTLSSCSDSEEQDMQQMLKRAKILKGSCLNGLSALKSNFTQKHVQGITKSEFERAFSRIFCEDVDTFTRTFSENMDTLEQQLTKETILESNCQNAFRVLKTQFEKIFTSVLIKPSSLDGTYARKDFHAYTGMEPQLFKETILKNFDFIENYMLKTIIHAQTIQKRLDDKKLQIQECTVQEVKASDAISEDKAQERCMVSFRQLHSHLKLLSNNDLKGTRTEYGFKRAFATLFGQDLETFTGTMFLNMDQLEKQLDNEEFQEIGSMAAFKVLETQFQMFIKSRIYLDDEYVVMTRNYFLQYTQLEILEFRDTLIQHMESVKKSIDKRALHKREYDSWVNERQMQTTEEKVDTSKALDASLVDTESSGTESKEQDTSSRSGNDAHADDADIRPIYDEEPMAENAEKCHDTRPLPAKLTDHKITELPYQSLKSENISLKEGQHGQFSNVKSNEAKVKHDIDVIETINIKLEHKVAKLLKENETLKRHYKELSDSIKTTRTMTIEQTTSLIAKNVEFKAQLQEKGFAITTLKNELRKLTGNSVNTKMLKPRFDSQVDVNNDLSKPVTTHYLPKEREFAVVKPHHVIASSESRNNSKNMPRFSSNDMVTI
ncbi:hypothetical protein Tco_1249058 [Tanacetum coccineum]